MKNLIIIGMFLSLNICSFAAESGEIINKSKMEKEYQFFDIESLKEKEQELLNLYKDQINLLSYKERQLKTYENSLKGIKAQIDVLQSDLENRQNTLNEKEVTLLKKELQLRDKERDLNQLEEKLSQIDNIQLIRANAKFSTPSVVLKPDLKIDETYNIQKILAQNNIIHKKEEPLMEKKEPLSHGKVKDSISNTKSKKYNTKSIESGLGAMKKDILKNNDLK